MKIQLCFSLAIVLLNHLCIAQIELDFSKIDSNRYEMYQYIKKNKISSIANFYAEDAKVDGYDAKLEGIIPIRKYWANIHGNGVDWTWEIFNTSGENGIVFQTGISHLTLSYQGKNTIYSSLFSVIWKKQLDGEFKIVSDYYRPLDQFNIPNYEVEKDSTWIKTKNDSIFSILFKPRMVQKLKMPAIYCLQGGGSIGIRNYFYEAELFARLGFVTILCDKAGDGKSIGMSSWITQTFEQKTVEYSAILDWLIKQPFVDSSIVGVHGPSEGGRLALSLALANPKRIKFVNAVSAPLETLKENQLYAIENLLISQGYNYSVISKALGLFNEYFDAIKNKNIPKELIDRVNKLRLEYPKLYLPLNSTNLPNMPQSADINYTVGSDLNQIKCPVYFQYGEDDAIVNVKKSISLIPKNENITVKVYDKTDHSINYKNGDTHGGYHIDKIKWLLSIINN